ncbi:hypothetical protein NLU13_5750 [Sarocladium strictum]|uniref:Transaldolase n=1 Tax=Sarocladium strictum TaxID=5046 RepID=A0AA39L7Y7_SARSR|nr:hypothetical protein NLU13_5750 [Sarocladium strictum]
MPQTLLDLLRSCSAVDCDTLDAEVAKSLGPFVDCTSNQAIAYGELSKKNSDGNLKYQQLILDSLAYAKSNASDFPEVNVVELAVEVATIKLAHLVAPYVTGYLHIQANPKYCYDKGLLIQNSRRIAILSGRLNPDLGLQNICIKILATWEGLQACAELQKQGIFTLATSIVSLQQAALAASVGCAYMAPYINELRVHFDESYVDEDKLMAIPGQIRRLYEKNGSKTVITVASLTSITEIMQLAGSDHITISPPLLAQLSQTPADSFDKADVGSVFEKSRKAEGDSVDSIETEAAWRYAFSRDDNGEREVKMVRAINIFCNKQNDLEDLVRLCMSG